MLLLSVPHVAIRLGFVSVRLGSCATRLSERQVLPVPYVIQSGSERRTRTGSKACRKVFERRANLRTT
jgi:hypothetical protein